MATLDDALAAFADTTDAMDDTQAAPSFAIQTQAKPATATLDAALATWADQEEKDSLRASSSLGLKKDPAKATKVLQLFGKTGLPQEFIERNQDFVEQESLKQNFDPEKLMKESPAFAAWLAESPDHVAAVKHETPTLSYLERQWRRIKDAGETGPLMLELADLGNKAFDSTITPQDRARQAEIESRLQTLGKSADENEITGFFEGMPAEAVKQAPIYLRSLGGKVKAAGEGTAIGAAAGAVAGAATLNPALPAAGATMGALTGWRYGAAIEAAKIERGHALLDYEKLTDEQGNPLDSTTIKGLSLMAGAINGALEGLTGVEALANKLPGVRNITKDGIKELLKTPTSRAAILSMAKQVGDTMVTEGVTEALQMYVTKTGGVLSQWAVDGGGPLDVLGKIFSAENAAQAIQEFKGGAQGGGGIATVMTVPGLVQDLQQVRQAKQNQRAFEAMGQAVASSQFAQDLPDHLKKIITEATKNGPVEQVYIPTDSFNTYFQGQGADPREVAAAITGNVEAYDQAVQTGQDLAISTGDYVAKLAGTEHNAFFAQELRTSLDMMNARESDEWQQMMTEQEQARQEGVQAAPITDPSAKVRQDIAGLLQGFASPDVIDQYAAPIGERYLARAVRRGLGEDPFELFQRMNLQVTRQIPDILKKLGTQQTELDALLNRLRNNEFPKPAEIYGQSLTEFLKEKGGIQDQGGELTARQVDANRKAFQKKLVQPKGLTLDQAAELATAAGYLEQRDPGALLDAIDKDARGTPVYAIGKENARLIDVRTNLDSLKHFLASRAIDLTATSNEEIKALLGESIQQTVQDVAGTTFMQGGKEATLANLLNELPDALSRRITRLKDDFAVAKNAARSGDDTGSAQDDMGYLLEAIEQAKEEAVTKQVPPVDLTEERITDVKAEMHSISEGIDNAFAGEVNRALSGTKEEELDAVSVAFPIDTDSHIISKMSGLLDELRTLRIERAIAKLQSKGGPLFQTLPAEEGQTFAQPVYHGTPHAWEPEPGFPHGRPRLDKIGTGEGAQVYGWGWYSAEAQEVANSYATNVKNAVVIYNHPNYGGKHVVMRGQEVVSTHRSANAANKAASKIKGSLYTLDIPDSVIPKLLNWDKPLSEQTKLLQALQPLIAQARKSFPSLDLNKMTGEDFYHAYTSHRGGNAKTASEALRDAGIPGLKYLDQVSRNNASWKLIPASESVSGKWVVSQFGGANASKFDTEAEAQAFLEKQLGGQTSNYVIWDQPTLDKIALLERNGKKLDAIRELYQGSEDLHKASITFGPDAVSIKLLEKADLTSFIHELGHLYLNELIEDATTEGTPQQLRDDLDTLLKWMRLEVTSVSGKDAIMAAIQTKHHEQFARGWEAYSMEGKAPSLALREAFARFRQWFIEAYRSLTTAPLNVQLTKEVRGVMDRLIATDEAIDEAAQEADVLPAFTDAESARMTPPQWTAYEALVRKASLTSRERLQLKLMAQAKREQAAWWKDRRDEMGQTVTKEVNEQPEYIALAVLKTGKMPDGSEIPNGIQTMKLDKKGLADAFGKDFVTQRVPRGTTAKDGMHHDAAAQLFGFSTGEDFVMALVNARDKHQLIEAETDRRMQETYGDMRFDGTIAEEAKAAVLNEYQEEVIAAELKAINQKRREVAPFLKAANQEQHAAQRQGRDLLATMTPTLEATRKLARNIMSRTALKNINANHYSITARQASKKATAAIAKQDWVTAGHFKQQEMLNLALYREATLVREKADTITEHMRNLAKKPAQERLGKAGADYLEQINSLLERYEFVRVSNRQLEKQHSLREWITEKEKIGDTLGEEFTVPDAVLDEARRVNYQVLTPVELSGLFDVVKQIEHFASLKNKLLKAKKQRDRAEAKAELLQSLAENLTDKGPPPLTKSGLTNADKATRLAQKFDASMLKTEQVIEWLDGGSTGPWHDYLWNGSVDAQAAELDATKTITAKIAQAVASIPKEIRAHMLDTVKIQGIENVITRKDLLGVALNVGNESNYTKQLKGMGWTAEQVQAMVDHLSAEEIAFVNQVHATLESLWPEIAALQKRLTGLPPEKIEPKAFSSQNGTIVGGYYPVMYNTTLSQQGELQLASTIGKLVDDGYTRATTPRGHTKARIENAAYPFDLDIDRLPSHIAGVVKDLTHREWLLDANWIVNHPQIRAALVRRIGEPMTLRLAEWVGQVVNDRNQVSLASLGFWHRLAEHFRYNVSIVAMGFKASTLLSQLAGVAPAIEVIGGKEQDGAKWFAKGVGDVLRRPQSAYDFMTAKSGEMRHRIKTRDRDMRDNLRALEGKTDTLSQVQEVSMYAIGYAELMVSMPSWFGAYYKALDAGMTEDDAVRMGDRAVRLGQGAGGAKDLAAVAARSDQLMRLLTMFYTPFSALYGRLRAIGHDFGGIKDVPGTAFRLFWTVLVAATLGELAAGHGPDKKKDEDWLNWWIKNVALYPFLSVPWLRDAISSISTGYGYQFTPMAQAGRVTIDSLLTGKKVIEGEKDLADFAEKAAQAFSYLVGLPSGQLTITGTYLYDLAEGKAHPDDIFEFGKGFIYKRTKEERK
ncbi:MAG: hypothetical protein ACYCZR_00915 [Burkholderiales bacterium]